MKEKRELQKSVPTVADVLKDVPALPKEKMTPASKPETVKDVKQTIKQPAPEPVRVESKPTAKIAQVEPILIIQQQPVDPHCGLPSLSKQVVFVMGKDPADGNLYAFADRRRKTIQVLQNNPESGGPCLLKKKLGKAAEWPRFTAENKNSPVVLKGTAKDKFLQKIGLPKDLSK
jgi:hypothetical protein